MQRAQDNISENYSAIKRKIDSDYINNTSLWQTFFAESAIDTRLEAGDASLMNDLNPQASCPLGKSWYFNRVRPLCNMVSGYQRRNRKSTIVAPLENADQETADQWTKILFNIYKREYVYEKISDAFHHGACITGLNLLHAYLDYSEDPISGDVKVENCAFNTFFMDPYFRDLSLSDCNFIWKRSYMTHAEAAHLLPEYYDQIMSLQGSPSGIGKDTRFNYMPEVMGRSLKNKVSYDEYYYRDWRKQKLLVDKNTGETLEIEQQSTIDVDKFLSQFPAVELVDHMIQTVRLCIMVADKVFYDGPSGLDCYPFVPVVGYYNPMMPYFYNRVQGICRSLRDPQILFNRRIILSDNVLESTVNTGWIFKENAVLDVKHLFQTGQGRVIPLKKEAQMTDIQQIPIPQIPPSFFQMQEAFSRELNLVSGINEELLGSAIDDKAGILSMLRQGAGLITLQPLFDNLDSAQNRLGMLVMKLIRSNYTPSKIKNMLEGQQPAPLFYNKAFGKYHCVVENGFNTETQRQLQLAQMIQLREIGVPIPPESLLDAATIQNKSKIAEVMQKQAQQQQQAEQMQIQANIQEQQARIKLTDARTTADSGLGAERYSRIEENKALAQERKAEAIKDDYQALLNFARALKEMDDIDIAQLQKIIALQNLLKEDEKNKEYPQTFQNGSELDRG